MYMWQWLPEKDIPNIFGRNVLWMCCGKPTPTPTPYIIDNLPDR
jgi:hypothetical protein